MRSVRPLLVSVGVLALPGGMFVGACGGANPAVGGDAGQDSSTGSSSGSSSGSTPDSGTGEVLANTDLSEDWYVAYSGGTGVAGFSSGQYCFRAASNAGYSFVLGYPDPTTNVPDFSLVAGASYTFSYEVSGEGVTTGLDLCTTGDLFEAKIGESATPFTAQVHWCDGVSSSLTTLTHTFIANGAEPITGLGVALEGNLAAGGQICLANVQLVKN